MKPATRARTAASLAILLAGCATGGTGSSSPAAAPVAEQPARASSPWPIQTRYDLDLWLHGYAMISDDTTQLPLFQRGYRDRMVAFKRRANVSTRLDANHDALHDRLARHPGYISGQFLPLYFAPGEAMHQAIALFLNADGNPQLARDAQQRAIIATFASVFPSAADREWLRTFVEAIDDEGAQYYHSYWIARQRDLAPVLARADSLWEQTYRAKLARYLDNEQLDRGIVYLSLPLDGEGRTITGTYRERGDNRITAAFPDTPAAAMEAVYVFAHEAVGAMTNIVVRDNTTPAEQRQGVSDRYTSAAAVRGGAMLLQRLAPELVAGYARYYVQAAGETVDGDDPERSLARVFPLPQSIVDAIDHQLDVVLGGI
jgi:hypothetical protein